MTASGVKLLGSWPSPFVNRVQMALKIKSIEYEFIEENILNKSNLLLETNPVHKKIPVLIHGPQFICESLIIVRYIDEVWSDGSSILPSDPYNRAMACFWAAYIDNKLMPTLSELKHVQGHEANRAIMEKFSEGFGLLEEAFLKCSEGKAYFGGDDVGFVDIILGSYLGWMRAIEKVIDIKWFDEAKYPGLAAWAKRFCEESRVKDVVPQTRKLLQLHKAMKEAGSL